MFPPFSGFHLRCGFFKKTQASTKRAWKLISAFFLKSDEFTVLLYCDCTYNTKDCSSNFSSKHSTNTVLCLLRNLLEQSLVTHMLF